MADGYQEIGRLDAIDGSAVCVGRDGDRFLLGFATPGRQMAVIDLTPEALDALRELLDRAAMPGVDRG